MRALSELISIIGSYKSGNDKVFDELDIDELELVISYFNTCSGKDLSLIINWRVSFIMELNRRIVINRDNKLKELGI